MEEAGYRWSMRSCGYENVRDVIVVFKLDEGLCSSLLPLRYKYESMTETLAGGEEVSNIFIFISF